MGHNFNCRSAQQQRHLAKQVQTVDANHFLSFKHTLQIWVAWSQRQFLSGSGEDTATLFVLIAQIRVADRPGRIEPRAVKRRPKPYPRLDRPRQQARMEIAKYGHAKKLQA
jgi:hypothetical protein